MSLDFDSQVPAQPETLAYAMKLVRRRKIVLEQLHPLPVDAAASEGGKSVASNCGGPVGATSALDF